MNASNLNNDRPYIPRKHQFEFYKDETGWYIDFPEFLQQGLGTKADLEMVAGADEMLDLLSNHADRIELTFSEENIPQHRFHLKMIHNNEVGATYSTNVPEVPEVWLCNVTKVIFGGYHPQEIFVV